MNQRRLSAVVQGTAALATASLLTGITAGTGHAQERPGASIATGHQETVAATAVAFYRTYTGKHRAAPAAAAEYQVLAGDTLSGISRKEYGQADCWPGIYRANSATISNPDLIYPGQSLGIPGACGTQAPPPAPVTTSVSAAPAASSGDGDGDEDDPAGSAPPAPAPQAPAPAPVAQGGGNGSGDGYLITSSFQACVIQRESGGNPQITNSLGYWGWYQFGYSTWVAAGGAPSMFGNADAAYQTQVFWQAYRLWGVSPWQPSDGCA